MPGALHGVLMFREFSTGILLKAGVRPHKPRRLDGIIIAFRINSFSNIKPVLSTGCNRSLNPLA
jgi:hypothetical protein